MRTSSRVTLTTISSLLLLFVVGLTLRGFGSIPTHAAKSTHGWRIIASPLIGGSTLWSVAAISAINAWAVGSANNSAFIEHWNGKQWGVVASPSVGPGELSAVKALSATNIWAVGRANGFALIEHYNGQQWSIVSSQNPGIPYAAYDLVGMTVVSSTNIWAAGYSNTVDGAQALVEHYDGFQWSVIPTPTANYYNFSMFNAINAASANDIWAVGSSWDATDSSDDQSTLAEHWDGFQWSVIGIPSPGYDDTLNAVIAVSSHDIRVVGEANSSSSTLAEHWDGIQWTYGVPPNGGFTENFLQGEVAFASNDVWAVGAYESTSPSYAMNTLVEQWDGAHWSIIASPNTTSYSNEFHGISKVPGTTTLWAVGDSGNGALIEMYS